MESVLNKMRADFDVVSQARKDAGEWTDDDIKEFNAAIKDCIKRNDTAALALWARWLADLSASVVFFNLVVKGTETAMRAAAAKRCIDIERGTAAVHTANPEKTQEVA